MKPNEVAEHLNRLVQVNSRSISGRYTFTAYIFRIMNSKKLYQAEVQNPNPPHEIYIVPLADLQGDEQNS